MWHNLELPGKRRGVIAHIRLACGHDCEGGITLISGWHKRAYCGQLLLRQTGLGYTIKLSRSEPVRSVSLFLCGFCFNSRPDFPQWWPIAWECMLKYILQAAFGGGVYHSNGIRTKRVVGEGGGWQSCGPGEWQCLWSICAKPPLSSWLWVTLIKLWPVL